MLCTATAAVISVGDQHKVREFSANQHNDVLQSNGPQILKACTQMKELTQISNDRPVHIITNVMFTMSCEIQPSLP